MTNLGAMFLCVGLAIVGTNGCGGRNAHVNDVTPNEENEGDDGGYSGQAFPLGSATVDTSYGYSHGMVHYVLIEVYDPSRVGQNLHPKNVTNAGGYTSVHVGDERIANIYNTQKLYVVHNEQLTIFDLKDCAEQDVPTATREATHAAKVKGDDVREFLGVIIKKLTKG